ncbi:MAG: radical SAM protein [Nannocystis sp.]|nr:radical SAM protein [Nannocystis sp.]
MSLLSDLRRRLPVLDEPLPPGKTRKILPLADGRAPTPRHAVWEFTLACDQRCLCCGPRAGAARQGELSTDESLRLVDELAELGVGEVTLIGGEAYLRPDFILVIRAIRARGMTCTLTTGGFSMTQERAEAMVEAGVQSVSVSIDGLEQHHDHLRGRSGSWQRAFRALRLLRAAGSKISANTQINRLTQGDLPELLELLAPEGIHAWQVQVTVAHGGAADHHELLLQPYMYLGLFPVLDRLADRCDQLRITLTPANSLGYFGPYAYKLRRRQSRQGHYLGCQAGIAGIAIESDGMIKNCPSLGGRNNVGGSWREHGLRAIWERAPELTYMRQRTERELWGYCAECYYASVCKAGCTSVSEPLLGRPGNNPMCHHRALEMDRMGLRERIEWVRPSAGEPFDNGLFRVIREPKDPELRARRGAVHIDEPRSARADEPFGPGAPVDLST